MKERLELFAQVQRPRVREFQREDGTKAKHFSGYAIVFDSPSVIMCDWATGGCFREYVTKGAITQETINGCDIICTAFHDREKLLARWNKGEGSMQLAVDDIGLKVDFDFDMRSATHADVEAAVERGDMPGMSFSFYETDYTYNDAKGADGIIDRHITNIASIFEVTVAANPAYPGTTASCQREWEALTRDEDELRRREEEEKEARHLLAIREAMLYLNDIDQRERQRVSQPLFDR